MKIMATNKNKVSAKVKKIVDQVAKLSVLELSELVEALQDKLGVSGQMAAVAPAPQAEKETKASEATPTTAAASQTVVITATGENKISVIKAIREIDQNIGLKEAKDMTEKLPTEILKDAKAEDAKAASDKLKAAGATVELK